MAEWPMASCSASCHLATREETTEHQLSFSFLCWMATFFDLLRVVGCAKSIIGAAED